MECSHAVDRMTADRRQVCHAHVPRPGFIDQRQSSRQVVVIGKSLPDALQEAMVDLVDDLQVSRQQRSKQG